MYPCTNEEFPQVRGPGLGSHGAFYNVMGVGRCDRFEPHLHSSVAIMLSEVLPVAAASEDPRLEYIWQATVTDSLKLQFVVNASRFLLLVRPYSMLFDWLVDNPKNPSANRAGSFARVVKSVAWDEVPATRVTANLRKSHLTEALNL